MKNLPAIPQDLLDALDARYPERCPDPEWTERQIWMRVGERRVIKFLKAQFDLQNENILRNTHVLENPEDA